MADADETVLYELKRKLQGSTSRRVRDSASAMDLAEIVMANSKLLPADLPARLRNHVFLLVHNALPTQARSRWHPAATAVCKLCGGGTEDLTHLHVTCPTVHTAKSVIITNSPNQGKFLSLRLAEAGDFLMQAVSPVKEDLVKLLAFSLAVWEIRRRVNEANRPPVVAVGRTIAARFQSLYAEITQKKLRKHRDKKKEKQTFLQLWNTLPVQSVRAFTDGSSYGNPGPAGCGVTYRCPGQARKDVSVYLHHNATNYVAELHGIRVACTKIHADMETMPPSERVPVYIFVDNQPAINAADGISRVRAQKRLVELVKQAVQTLRTVTSTTLLWVPGHAEIAGNDTADGLAKRGAKGNTSERKLIRFPSGPPVPVPARTPPPSSQPARVPSPLAPTERKSKRLREQLRRVPLVTGIDFSSMQAPRGQRRKKQKTLAVPVTCPHGISYDYNNLNITVDLPTAGLTCPRCRTERWNLTTIPDFNSDIFGIETDDPWETGPTYNPDLFNLSKTGRNAF